MKTENTENHVRITSFNTIHYFELDSTVLRSYRPYLKEKEKEK